MKAHIGQCRLKLEISVIRCPPTCMFAYSRKSGWGPWNGWRGASASHPPAQDLAEEGLHVKKEIPANHEQQHGEDNDAREGGGHRVVQDVHGARDGVAHELVADAAHDDRHRALAKAADETKDHRCENPWQR